MGITAFDQARLEDLRRITSLFDFLANPQGYQAFLAEVKEVLAGMDATIAAHTTVQEAQGYLEAAKAKVSEVNAYVEEQKKVIAADRAKALAELAEQKAGIEYSRTDSINLQKKTLADAALLDKDRAKVQAREAAVKELEGVLAARKTTLDAQEQELGVKLQKLAELSAVFKN